MVGGRRRDYHSYMAGHILSTKSKQQDRAAKFQVPLGKIQEKGTKKVVPPRGRATTRARGLSKRFLDHRAVLHKRKMDLWVDEGV